MEHDIDVKGYVDGTISKSEKLRVEEHIAICPACCEALEQAIFNRLNTYHPILSAKDCDQTLSDLEPSDLTPLPPALKARLNARLTGIRSMLSNALEKVSVCPKDKLRPLLEEVATLATHLLDSKPEPMPGWALDREVIQGKEKKIKLLEPGGETSALLSLDQYTVKFVIQPWGNQLQILDQGMPVQNASVRIQKSDGTDATVFTDENGWVPLCFPSE